MTETDLPTVTIGITAFNCEDTLRRAVASALEQDYLNKEILIVDDCSRDGTHDIALELAAAYKDIRVIRAPKNGGVAASRNLIINNTKADFIVFFDDDDVSEPDRISEQVKSILACEQGNHTRLVICHTARLVEYAKNSTRYERGLAQGAGPLGVSGSIVSEAILCGTSQAELKGACPTCCQMARHATYTQMDGFDENLSRSEDTDFSIRAAESGAFFVGIEAPLVKQIMTNGCEKSSRVEKKNWLYLLQKHRRIIERKMVFDFLILWLEFRYALLDRRFMVALALFTLLFFKYPALTSKKIYFAAPNLQQHVAMSKFTISSEQQK